MPESYDFKELDNKIRSSANWSFLSDSSKLANAEFYATGKLDFSTYISLNVLLFNLVLQIVKKMVHYECDFVTLLFSGRLRRGTEKSITRYHDLVRCYACNPGLSYLNADDDTLSEHIKNCTSTCAFLNELAGENQNPNGEKTDKSDLHIRFPESTLFKYVTEIGLKGHAS
ncbi:uncharacterized protein LOC128214549 isoform X2 [Mya arenaria]|uniref:uncharacterized protein LOC128214549 isoform X2 n=1 Tax=Mya arenaria TaxID=6604 RepID=UPI0022E92370|nr:uncharacterized protein LOC128214549 isoform X2 [Mya arenaria]XP_052777033.1 uncharacterized protein LOC128214549 isoform X2 [Mya arenaria]